MANPDKKRKIKLFMLVSKTGSEISLYLVTRIPKPVLKQMYPTRRVKRVKPRDDSFQFFKVEDVNKNYVEKCLPEPKFPNDKIG